MADEEERTDRTVRVMWLWVRALRNLFLINDFLFLFLYERSRLCLSTTPLYGWFLIIF